MTDLEATFTTREEIKVKDLLYSLRQLDKTKAELPLFERVFKMAKIFNFQARDLRIGYSDNSYVFDINKLESCRNLFPFFEWLEEFEGFQFQESSEYPLASNRDYIFIHQASQCLLRINAYMTNCRKVEIKPSQVSAPEPEYALVCDVDPLPDVPSAFEVSNNSSDPVRDPETDDIPF